MGATLLAISPQTLEKCKKFAKKKGYDFPLLSDPRNQVAEEYGLVFEFPDDMKEVYQELGINLPEFNVHDEWTLPIPARYIVDPSFTIRYAERDPDYTVRPEPDHTLEALRELKKQGDQA